MDTYIGVVLFGFKGVICMCLEYLFLMSMVFIQAYKIPLKSFSDWDHLQKTNGRPYHNFKSNCQLHKQNPYFSKRKLIKVSGGKTWEGRAGTSLCQICVIFTKIYHVLLQFYHPPHQPNPTKRYKKTMRFSFNKLCLNKCFGVFIHCQRRLQETWVTDCGISCPIS